MIVLSGRQSGSSRANLVLHSYGGMLFQRMVQLRQEPEVRQALEMLKGGRVTMLNTTTHYGHSEAVLGKEYVLVAQGMHNLISWLNEMDSTADLMRQTARANPFLAPAINAQLMAWQIQRDQLMTASTKVWVDSLIKKLSIPYAPEVDQFRLRLLQSVEDGASKPGWREAILRRSDDTLQLEFTKKDVEYLRRLKIPISLVHGRQDDRIPWVNARLLFTLLGIPAPEEMPPSGTVLTDPSGLFRLTIVESDHMFPVRQPDALAELLTAEFFFPDDA
jgi:pimeloyl-ACP methyl ester carboxylesterase